MSESVQFWLDNKMSAGIKMAAIGDQVLVVYREKFYVVEKDAAHTRGGKPIRYSNSSLPVIWKRALKGETIPAESLVMPADDALPVSSAIKRARVRKKSPTPSATEVVQVLAAEPSAVQPVATGRVTPQRNLKKIDIKPVAQAIVAAICPHCNHRHELPLEKGKNGKPFFKTCERCSTEFAVRFVQVMTYQAQVAGFR